ncbi:LysR substrate-binding domain-containing protein [Pikeienuella piscinae]|uniref:LysR substrate-binding domain-containing protein n=1 Tax=Pikeienuella piscinae TaxID=2748098 RepID=UPI001FE94C68|nr:LysR substrate-binding domain-containing protein [Pikeienuella piscinae]
MTTAQRALPPLNALRAFEVAGRRLNFRLAAEELGVSQGAVAQHVRGLEARLGLKLFERLPKGLALTDAGRSYHEEVAEAFVRLREATVRLEPQAARVTITATTTFASRWLIPRLTAFTGRHPDIDLRVLATDSVLNFQSDGVDLAVRQGRPPFGAGVEAERLFRTELVAVAAPDFLDARPKAAGLAALEEAPLLHDSHNLWPVFLDALGGRRERALRGGLRFNQTTLSVDAAMAGQGVALVARFLVAEDLRSGRLRLVVADSLAREPDYHLLAPRSLRRASATEIVRSWLLETARAVE